MSPLRTLLRHPARAALRLPVVVIAIAAAASGGRVTGQTGQTSARADAAISGVVIDGATKQPVPDAVVQLSAVLQRGYPEVQQRQFSDPKGRFGFTDLAAGSEYSITVVKSGYFDGAYGRDAGRVVAMGAIAVADGQWFKDANISLWRPGSLSGTVIDERGEPVIGVYVRAISLVRVAGRDRYAVGPLVMTDDRGMYRIGRLTSGRYVVMIPSVQSSTPSAASNAALLGLSAQNLEARRAAGLPLPVYDASMVDVDATTRVGVGGYPIPPPPSNGRAYTYPIAFSGGLSLAQATAVVLEAGADRRGVDVRLDPMAASRISGVVQGPPDLVAGAMLRLIAEGAEDLGMGGETGTSLVAPDGSFAFANVPSGAYTIEVPVALNQYTIGAPGLSLFYGPQLPRAPGVAGMSTMGGGAVAGPEGVAFSASTFAGKKHWARTAVTVNAGDVANVVVTLRPTGSIRGRLVGDADPGQPEPAPPRYVNLETATGSVWEGSPRSVYNRTAPAGEFVIDGVLPGLYLFRGESAPWMLKSVIVGGRDHTYTPLDTTASQDLSGVVVTFTNAIPTLSGIARETSGAPATRAAVIVFPVESDQWTNFGLSPTRIKSAYTSNRGSFSFRSIPAGDYYVVAVPGAQLSAWQEPDFFKRAQRAATRVTIDWGEKKTVDVRVAEIR